MKKLHPSILSAITGLLLYAAWPDSPLTGLIFIAFIPLLWIDRQGIRRARFFGWTYLSMLIWNIATTWWILNSTVPGGMGAILANSLLMCVPWILFHWIRQRMGDSFGYLSLVVFWLSFEYFHLQNWGLSWPWLTIGNVFATHPQWIQWYEFTGTSGGALWIMTVNILLFLWLWQLTQHRNFNRQILMVAVALIALPILLSPFLNTPLPNLLPTTVPTPNPVSPATPTPDKIHLPNIVLVQPNIDPYEKVAAGTFEAQLALLIRLSESAIDSNTVLLIWPETALFNEENGGIEEDRMKELHFLRPLWDFLKNHPRLNLLTGMESFRLFNDRHSSTAFPNPGQNNYVERYNAAAILDSSGLLQVYHKSRLVPGVETLPFFLHFIDSWFEKFGGTTEGYTGQPDRTPLTTSDHTYSVAPAVCYESIYGEFLSRYVRNGANLIAIITNDGWWGNTPGHRQHQDYARLRAVETRRWVVRSANTGISCVIDPNGRVITSRPWNQPATIKISVPPETAKTFYVQYGDCISRIAILLTILLFAWHFFTILKTRTSRG